MNFLKQLTDRTSSNNNISSSLLLAAGGALGALSTYLFLTDAGSKHRNRIMGKVQQLTSRAEKPKDNMDNSFSSPVHDNDENAAAIATPVSKAQNMVSHLKEGH